MARFTFGLGQCSFCGVSASRTSRLVGDARRRERICRPCLLGIADCPPAPALDRLPEPIVERPPELISTGEQFTAGDVLREFRRGVEAQIGTQDFAARRNLGIAYFEMGLLDEAIQEFEIAAQEPAVRAECFALIGRTLRVRGDLDRSITSITTALKTPGITEGQKAAFFFELGLSLSASDQPAKAAKAWQQAIAFDPSYRDRIDDDEPIETWRFTNAREAFATGESRDAFRVSRAEDSVRPSTRIAALEARLRHDPTAHRERATLANLLLTVGRQTEAGQHFLVLGEGLRSAGDAVHAMGAFQASVRAECMASAPLAMRALAELRGEPLPVQEPIRSVLDRFRCSFCEAPADFQRPNARVEDGTTMCAECIDEARKHFSH